MTYRPAELSSRLTWRLSQRRTAQAGPICIESQGGAPSL
jgi:hypothetical protein